MGIHCHDLISEKEEVKTGGPTFNLRPIAIEPC